MSVSAFKCVPKCYICIPKVMKQLQCVTPEIKKN